MTKNDAVLVNQVYLIFNRPLFFSEQQQIYLYKNPQIFFRFVRGYVKM